MINYKERAICLETYLTSFGQNLDKGATNDQIIEDQYLEVKKETAIKPRKSKNHSKIGRKSSPLEELAQVQYQFC